MRLPTKPDFRSTWRHGSNSKRKHNHRRWEDPIDLQNVQMKNDDGQMVDYSDKFIKSPVRQSAERRSYEDGNFDKSVFQRSTITEDLLKRPVPHAPLLKSGPKQKL